MFDLVYIGAQEPIGSTIVTFRALLSAHTPPLLLNAAHAPVGNQLNSFVICNLLCLAPGSVHFSASFTFGTLRPILPRSIQSLSLSTSYSSKDLTSAPRISGPRLTRPFPRTAFFFAPRHIPALPKTRALYPFSTSYHQVSRTLLLRRRVSGSLAIHSFHHRYSREVGSGTTGHPWAATIYQEHLIVVSTTEQVSKPAHHYVELAQVNTITSSRYRLRQIATVCGRVTIAGCV